MKSGATARIFLDRQSSAGVPPASGHWLPLVEAIESAVQAGRLRYSIGQPVQGFNARILGDTLTPSLGPSDGERSLRSRSLGAGPLSLPRTRPSSTLAEGRGEFSPNDGLRSESLNHPSPGLRPPSPHPMGRGQGEGVSDGWRVHGEGAAFMPGATDCRMPRDGTRTRPLPAGEGGVRGMGRRIIAESLSENGARLCRRSAAARREHSKAPIFWDLLRLVEDDTAALRGFQTGAEPGVVFGRCRSRRARSTPATSRTPHPRLLPRDCIIGAVIWRSARFLVSF